MLSSLLRSIPGLRRSWQPLTFSSTNFMRIPASEMIEEELIPDYVASRYYPARIGEVVRDQYQVVGKLGFGASSTVWLARDLSHARHVAIKVFVHSTSMGDRLDNEVNMYKRIERVYKYHPGRKSVRKLLDSFDLNGPDGQHRCLVHPPLWDSVLTFLHRNPIRRLPLPVLTVVLKSVFQALDFLHTECQIIHTDIKADNIMLGIADDSVFTTYEEHELHDPCPRKELPDGRFIYASRQLPMPKKYGYPVLCDFGSAVLGDEEHSEDIQPNVYRAPEVILQAPWTYSVDVWNVGCMIWDIYEGGHLFTGHDPELQTYRSRAHLAEMVALLGPPPADLLGRGTTTSRFFSDDGELLHKLDMPNEGTLRERETNLNGDNKEQFLRFMARMLQWDPAKRSSSRDLAEDEWLKS